jgi:hypothetical protein
LAKISETAINQSINQSTGYLIDQSFTHPTNQSINYLSDNMVQRVNKELKYGILHFDAHSQDAIHESVHTEP